MTSTSCTVLLIACALGGFGAGALITAWWINRNLGGHD